MSEPEVPPEIPPEIPPPEIPPEVAPNPPIIPKVIFVLGTPGTGKSTQCGRIVEMYGFKHLSAGRLLREELKNPDSEHKEIIEAHFNEGKIVPGKITVALLERAMREAGTDKFLIDAFPGNKDNFNRWRRRVSKRVKLLFVLYFTCNPGVCMQRCLVRGIGPGGGRADDGLEGLKKRVYTYMKETKPVIEHYERKKMVHQIDAANNEERVFKDVKAIMDSNLDL